MLNAARLPFRVGRHGECMKVGFVCLLLRCAHRFVGADFQGGPLRYLHNFIRNEGYVRTLTVGRTCRLVPHGSLSLLTAFALAEIGML